MLNVKQYIMGRVIKPERPARSRAAFKLQCIATSTFLIIIIFTQDVCPGISKITERASS